MARRRSPARKALPSWLQHQEEQPHVADSSKASCSTCRGLRAAMARLLRQRVARPGPVQGRAGEARGVGARRLLRGAQAPAVAEAAALAPAVRPQVVGRRERGAHGGGARRTRGRRVATTSRSPRSAWRGACRRPSHSLTSSPASPTASSTASRGSCRAGFALAPAGWRRCTSTATRRRSAPSTTQSSSSTSSPSRSSSSAHPTPAAASAASRRTGSSSCSRRRSARAPR